MWEQIKKKWVKKQGNIWINDQQKEINADKYVNSLIEQTYNKHYEKYEESQKRLSHNETVLRTKLEALKKAYLYSIIAP